MAAIIRKEPTPYLPLGQEVRDVEQSAPELQMTPAVQSRANDIYKRAEALYLATYKAIHLNGRETSESRLVRLAIKLHCSAGSERLEADHSIVLAASTETGFALWSASERIKEEKEEDSWAVLAAAISNYSSLESCIWSGRERLKDAANRILEAVTPRGMLDSIDIPENYHDVNRNEVNRILEAVTPRGMLDSIDHP